MAVAYANVRVVDAEAGALEALDVVDLGPEHELHRRDHDARRQETAVPLDRLPDHRREKQWRNRDDEIVDSFASRSELLAYWDLGCNRNFVTLGSLKPSDLLESWLRHEVENLSQRIERSPMTNSTTISIAMTNSNTNMRRSQSSERTRL